MIAIMRLRMSDPAPFSKTLNPLYVSSIDGAPNDTRYFSLYLIVTLYGKLLKR
jgi:hypothetical protein